MPVVTEMVHPMGFSFAVQKQIYTLRKVDGLPFTEIAKRVRNLQNKRPRPRLVAQYFYKFQVKTGRCLSQYHKCGRKVTKATKPVVGFLVKTLLAKRVNSTCASTILQQDLARQMGVNMSAPHIRKLLRQKGYQWLPRAQKRKYSPGAREARMKFARKVLSMTLAELRETLSFAMDGVILAMPPTDP